MSVGIYGSTLTDLGRNALADQQEQDENARGISNQFLQQQIANQQARAQAAQNQTQNNEINARYNYLGNQLAQQRAIADTQWNTPNATTTAQNANQFAIANLPYEKMTPTQKAQIDFQNKYLQMQQNNPYGFLDPATRDKMIMDKFNSAKQEGDASDMMNQLTQSNVATVAQPVLQDRLDSGMDNPGFHFFGGGLYSKNAADASKAIVGSAPPPQFAIGNSYENDPAIQGTKGWFNNNRNQFIDPAAQAAFAQHPEIAQFTKWDAVLKKWIPKSQALTPAPTQPQPTNPIAPAMPPTGQNQFLQLPQATPAPSRVVIQNGSRYQMNPDGSYQFLGGVQ
jgi:hypothetical protein